MRAVTEKVSGGFERADDRIGRLDEAFQRELLGVVDRLVTAAAAEADQAAERARSTGQIALDAASVELEQRAKQCSDLTESLRQLETRAQELRLALHAAHTELGAERARVRGLTRQLEAQVSERARLLTAFKTVQQACAVAESNSEGFEVRNPPAESRPDRAAENALSAADPEKRDAAAAAPAGVMPAKKLKFVGNAQPRAIELPSSLAEYSKPLFPREAVKTGQTGSITDEETTRRHRPRTSL